MAEVVYLINFIEGHTSHKSKEDTIIHLMDMMKSGQIEAVRGIYEVDLVTPVVREMNPVMYRFKMELDYVPKPE